ncbi:class II aldolase/adducin family protein [Saccharopolyspora sp. K220]|uniref:class II aldolase/adducin family protein n=1 Tax=Saccharopolyspora soli TaxID=2926618 RepID=UPI001F5AA6DA|nr:class II aldolase/adducin family protein [Saccharopolyspora soli]MCI2418386.1 class II aldolase/adducin family protein [Saccharopolyspora soli]
MTESSPGSEDAQTVALACRVLAHQGLAEDVLGHVSLRTGPTTMLVRSRGPEEEGLLFSTTKDVREVDLDATGELGDGYRPPNELPIHAEVMRARPDVRAVVHVHPPAVVAADLAGLPLRPIIGAYNIPALRMAEAGIPVFPRGALITRRELGVELAQAMGDAPVCLLRAHGLVTVGDTVAQAVVRALNIDALARLTLRLGTTLHDVPDLPPEDLAELPDLGSGFNDGQIWRHQLARLRHAGLCS